MVTKIKTKLKNKSGQSMLTPVMAVLICTAFLAVAGQYLHLYGTLSSLTNYIEQTVIKTATNNAYNVFSGVREGNSSAHQYAGSGVWNAVVSTGEVKRSLKSNLELEENGNSLMKYNDGGDLLYGFEDIQSYVTNVAVGTGSADIKLTFHTTATAVIPIEFMGSRIEVRKEIKLDSHYIARY